MEEDSGTPSQGGLSEVKRMTLRVVVLAMGAALAAFSRKQRD
jgi:hypothetical protein